MADRVAIEQMLASWAYGYDQGEPERMRAAFTDDAEMVMKIGVGDDAEIMGPYIGADQVMELFTSHQGEQQDQRRHVTTNLVILEDGEDEAQIASFLSLFVTADGVTRLQATGVYYDRVVRVGSEWKIANRRLELDSHF